MSDRLVSFEIESHGKITTAAELVWKISKLVVVKKDHKFWYRGIPDSVNYQLRPSIGRSQKYARRQIDRFSLDQEKYLLHRFRRRAYPLVQRALTAGEAIFLARHYGLPTRLLDWTANPLIALYFSCISHIPEEDNQHGKVWAMVRREGTEKFDHDPFDIATKETEDGLIEFLTKDWNETEGGDHPRDVIKIIYPFYNSPRLLAQDGAFTVHTDPGKPIEYYERQLFAPENLDIEALYYWIVPADAKPAIIRELSGLGITHRSAYPDLDGIARSLWETEVLWKGCPY